MKYITLIVCFIFTYGSIADDYFTVEEFLNNNPNQLKISQRFEEVVRGTGKKVTLTKEVKIAIIYPGEQLSDYWERSVKSLRLRLEELGIKYKIQEYFSRIGQYREQTTAIKSAISNDPNYLIFTLDAKKHKKIISKILARGKTKVILQNITTPLREWGKNQPFLYVGFDHLKGAKLIADYLRNKVPSDGKYATFYFKKGYVNDLRGHGFVSYLNKHSKLKLDSSFYTFGDFSKSKKAIVSLGQSASDLDFVYACSTDTALGLIAGLKELKLKRRPLVNGWGGGDLELQSLIQGDLDFTVMRMNDDNGVAMAEAIRLNESGRAKDVPTIYSGEFQLIEKDTLAAELDKLKKRAFRYSGVPD